MPRRNRPQKQVHHSRKGFLNMIEWLTSILVSLSVGFSMIGNGFGLSLLTLPTWIGGATATAIVGWIIVLATFVGIISAIFRK
jgi:hypothetical protein